MRVGCRLVACLGLALAVPAQAAVTTIDFTGSGVPSQTTPAPYAYGFYDLTNTATGDTTVPAFTLSVGDELKGTVTFATPVTMPAASYEQALGLVLSLDPSSDLAAFKFIPDIHFYDGNTEVIPTASTLSNFGYSLLIGSYVVGKLPAFSFDKVEYDFLFTDLYDNNLDPVSSGTVAAETSEFVTLAVSTPEPESWMMLIAGFGAIGAMLRRRQRAAAAATEACPAA